MNHNIKPLSEFADELRRQEPRNYASENAEYYLGFDAGMARAADLLQAWLREWDEAFGRQLLANDISTPRMSKEALGYIKDIRQKLLGTTPKGSS